MLADRSRVALKPAATLRCTMAAAVADWVRTDVAALASSLNTAISEIDNFDSFACRGRNRVAGAQLSEHGKANALDIRSLKFADGRVLELTDRSADRTLRERVLHSVCTRFSTVLGPDSDWFHENHIHLDLAERRSNYRICEWDVLDPLPVVAPLLPVARPDDAPGRKVREQDDLTEQQPSAAATRGEAKGGGTKRGAPPSEIPVQQAASAKPGAVLSTDDAAGKNRRAKGKGHRPAAPLSIDLRKSF